MGIESTGGRNYKSAQNNGAAGTVNVTLPAVVGRTNYLSGFTIDGLGATAAGVAVVSITGLQGGTMTRRISIPAGITTPINRVEVAFQEPIPASAPNTAIVLQIGTFGAGNTEQSGTAWGWDQ